MNILDISKTDISFIGGGVTACVGAVISVNPVTIKIMSLEEQIFSNSRPQFAGEITLKISGLSYLVLKIYPIIIKPLLL